ncbi:MAG: flippase-like domain-containing protein [Actinomycetota bacterium]|nr:flippase-like domain-containing protein [Actinomycetota bacterium]
MLKRTLFALVLSLVLGFAGLYLVAGGAVFRSGTYQVQNSSISIMVLIVAAFLGKWLSPAARIGLLCRAQKVRFPYRYALLVHLSAMLIAAFTPNNTAVGPATAAALSRLGVPLGRGIGVVVQVFVLDLIFFSWAVPASVGYLLYSNELELPSGVRAAAFSIAALAVAGAVILTRYPRLVVRFILAAAKWPPLWRFAPRLRKTAREYYRSAKAFLHMPAIFWVSLNLVTVVGWFSSFVLFWALLKFYGVEADLLATIATLSSVTLVSHVVPTPGASGFVESVVGFSIGARAGGHAAAALLIWRLASFYAIFLLGPAAAWLLYLSHTAAATGTNRSDGTGRI